MPEKKQALGGAGNVAFPGNNLSAAMAICRKFSLFDGLQTGGKSGQKQNMLTDSQFNLEWKRAKSLYNYPTINDAKAAAPEGGHGGCFDFSSRETSIDPEFIQLISDKTGLPPQVACLGIMIHEIGHYMVYPRSLANIIMAWKIGQDYLSEAENRDENFQNHVHQTWADMANDISSVCNPLRRDSILAVREATQKVDDDPLRSLMLSYLRLQAGQKPGINPKFKKHLETMIDIDFLSAASDLQALRYGLFVWMEIVRDFKKNFPHKGDSSPCCEQAGGQSGCGTGAKSEPGNGGQSGSGHGAKNEQGNCGQLVPSDIDLKGTIKNASRAEIEEALREISKRITRGEFRRMRDLVAGTRGDRLPSSEPRAISIGLSSGGELKVDAEVVEYYHELAKSYPIAIVKKPIKTTDVRKSFGATERFRMGADPNLAILSSSGGRLMPGLTKKVQIVERPRTTVKYDTPHALIVIDSSGSMPNPANYKSMMVLSAVCAALSYHKLGSHVGVINFSGDSFYLSYTRDLGQILASIVAYQNGGTIIDIELVKQMLGPEASRILGDEQNQQNIESILRGDPSGLEIMRRATKKNVSISTEAMGRMLEGKSIDMLMYTDLGIANLDEVLELCDEKAQVNRITLISNSEAPESLSSRGKISIYDKVDSIDDMVKITVGSVSKGVNAHAYSSKAEYGSNII